MISNVYEEYASIQAQISALEAKKEQLRPAIIQMMIDKGEKKVVTEVGSFSISPRKTWTYPANVENLADEYKSAKALAESTGEATYEEKPSLTFTQIKL